MGSDSGNSGSGKDAKANSGLSVGGFFSNMAEDLGSIANGTATNKHSAYDNRNAQGMADKHGGNAKDYLPGEKYGPESLKYSRAEFHRAGLGRASSGAGALGRNGYGNTGSEIHDEPDDIARRAAGARQAEEDSISPETLGGAKSDTLGQNGFLKSDTLRAHQTSAALAQDTLAQDNRRTAPKVAPKPDEIARPAPEQRTARQHNNTQSDPRGAGLTAGTQNAETFGMGLVGTGLANGKTNKQQARNVERHNALKEKHAKTLEKIREKQAKNRQRVNDWLSEMSKPQNQPANRPATQSAAETRAKAWDAVKAAQANAPSPQATAAGTVGQHGQNVPADVTY